MITYEITATVEPDYCTAYEQYMSERHIPDLLATGCFMGAIFARSEPGRYRIRYDAPDQAALDVYLTQHVARLRADFADHFPTGVALTREVWAALASWLTTGVADH